MLVTVRERNVLDVLDLALEVIRSRPRPIAAAALVGIAPCAAFNYAVYALLPEVPALWWGLLVLQVPWATAPLTVVLGDLMFGGKSRTREIVKRLARSIGALFLYQFLIRSLLLWTCLPGILIPFLFSFLNPVILLERERGSKDRRRRKLFQTLRRSATLSGDRGSELLGFWLAQMGFGALFLLGFRTAASSLWNLIVRGTLAPTFPDWNDDAAMIEFVCGPTVQAGAWIVVTFFATANFLSYIDQRIRIEGWAVEVSLSEVARGMRENDRVRSDLFVPSRLG